MEDKDVHGHALKHVEDMENKYDDAAAAPAAYSHMLTMLTAMLMTMTVNNDDRFHDDADDENLAFSAV